MRPIVAAMVAVLVLLSGCGGDDASDEAVDTTPAPVTGGDETTTTSGTTEATETTAPPRREHARPAGGPTDPVFPPGTDAYTLLVEGRCDELQQEVASWEAQSVEEVEGSDTVELYRSAAHACLGEWDEAAEAFDRISDAPDFEFKCGRAAVYAWLSEVIGERQADPDFDPVFVESTAESPCPDEE